MPGDPRDQRIRIGIDVGGTFTHAVAVDASTVKLIGKVKVPTTHRATDGVARGIVDSLLALLDRSGIAPGDVTLIAHSTTQATNALLEGDVATVGIVGIGSGLGGWLARRQTAIKPIPLARDQFLKTLHRFIPAARVNADTVGAAIDSLRANGAGIIVAAAAFSVDDPGHENLVCDIARKKGLPATASHHVSQLHGLGVRTRTAVINASMIPTMIATADMTEQAVRQAGIKAPVMIMRSDGGIMDIEQMRRRPILTMLSGPAAGVAAALLYARVSDGIFLEVGGTSTDISVIKNGRTRVRAAEIGGKKLFVNTLDVRTIGVAGGSLVAATGDIVSHVGPRSAHIADLSYLSFTDIEPARLVPLSNDRADGYLTLRADEETFAVTPTCASNYLDLVDDGDPARGRNEQIRAGMDALAPRYGLDDGAALARRILDLSSSVARPVVEALMEDYRLDRGIVRLLAGGGGGSAIVPYLARQMGLPFDTAPDADVISAIGVALALVRDSVERTLISPTEEDIRAIRAAAVARVVAMGATEESIEVVVEVDTQRNLLRATAEGALDIRQQDLQAAALSPDQRREQVNASIGPAQSSPRAIATAGGFEAWSAIVRRPRLWRFFPEQRRAMRVLDTMGRIRWSSNHADFRSSRADRLVTDLLELAEQHTRYTDAGATLPACFALLDERIIDLAGLSEPAQIQAVLQMEVSRAAATAPAVALVSMQR